MKQLYALMLLFIFMFSGLNAQSKKVNSKKTTTKYPESFTISKADYDRLFTLKENESIKTAGNKYLDKAVLELHSNNGDMQLLRIRMNYFPKSNLMIQVNGEHSTVVFLLSDDKTISYKGKLIKEVLTLVKCSREEIVSE